MDPNSYFLPSRVEVVTLYDKPEPDVLQSVLYAKVIRQKWMPGSSSYKFDGNKKA